MHKRSKLILIYTLFLLVFSLSACSLDLSSGPDAQETGEVNNPSVNDEEGNKQITSKSTNPNSVFFADFEKSRNGFELEDTTDDKGKIAIVEKDGRSVLELGNTGEAVESHKIQAKNLGIDFQKKMTYAGSVWMKGEGEGKVFVSVERAVSPWDSLGLWKEFELSDEWKKYDLGFEVTKTADPKDIKLSIQIGAHQGKVWIDDLEFIKR